MSLKVTSRMTMALVASGLVILSAFGIQTMLAEERDLRQAALREIELLGRSLQVAFENALRDRQASDVIEMVERLREIDPGIEVMIYDHAGRSLFSSSLEMLSASDAGRQPAGDEPANNEASYLEALGDKLLDDAWQEGPESDFEAHELLSLADAADVKDAGDAGDDVRFFSAAFEAGGRLVLEAGLEAADGRRLGRLVLVRPTGDIQRDLEATQVGIIWLVILFIVLSVIAGQVAGAMFLRRPLRRMLEAIRQVRLGDLSSRLHVQREDEIGLLSREFNAMCADLRSARENLEQQEISRSQIERALQRADKLIAVGQLSAGLAHEIGSPLQVVSGRARALLDATNDPGRIRHHATIIAAQSERIARIVEQLLCFSRRRLARLAVVEPAQVLGEVVELLRVEAERKGLSLSLVLGEPLPPIEADSDQLQQVILNLLTNAMTVTEPGGRIEVRVERDKLLRAGSRKALDALCISVSDTGCGIPETIRERIFEPFFTTRVAEGGTGLGLAVVAAIVNEHMGEISVESSLGLGSCFRVCLPLAQARQLDEGARV